MDKKVLHIVFVLLLVLAIPFSHVAKPVVIKTPVKHQKASQPSEESSKAFVQPQVFHAQATSAHVLTPATLAPFHCEIIFPQEEVHAASSFTLLDKGTSKFFKTLFRHFIATQAP
ncbi:MAG: hypothetical protein K0R51_1414 [Cytophagaceae bacterium]|jgi:hypothetical protein|nr:hypothetical protein [Cytophagaceae bacterium]